MRTFAMVTGPIWEPSIDAPRGAQMTFKWVAAARRVVATVLLTF
jgi:hypothetical protein